MEELISENTIQAMESYLILYGIISLAVLICFFVLCYNVAKIKKILEDMQFQSRSPESPTNVLENIRFGNRTSVSASSNKDSNSYWACPKCQFKENPNSSFKCTKCGYSLNT